MTESSELVNCIPEEVWQIIVQRAIYVDRCQLLACPSFSERRYNIYEREIGILADQFFAIINSPEDILQTLVACLVHYQAIFTISFNRGS